MNSVVLHLVAPAAATAEAPAGSAAKDAAPGTDSFGALFAKLGGLATVAAAPPRVAAVRGSAPAVLEIKIAKLLQAGLSDRELIATLAKQLAAGVAQALGRHGIDARKALQAVFSGALAPPGDESAGRQSIADRARTLARRFQALHDLATSILNGQSGQQNQISGTFLDAKSAKETPALPTDAVVASALQPILPEHIALAVTASRDRTIAAPAAAHHAVSSARLPAVVPAETPPRPAFTRSTAADPATLGSMTGAPAQPATGADRSAAIALQPALQPALAAGIGAVAAPLNASARRSSVDGPADGRSVNLGLRSATAGGNDTPLGRALTRAALVADTSPAPADEPAAAKAPASDTAVSAFIKSFETALNSTPRTPGSAGDAAAALPVLAATDAAPAAAALAAPPAPFSIGRADVAVTPPPAATPVEQSPIVDQVLRGVFMRNVGESSEMRLSLTPDTLGDVNVKLVVTAGNVTAHVTADTPEVRDALVAAQPQLTRSLADAGLKLQSFNVDLSGGGFGNNASQQNPAQHDNRTRTTLASIDDELDATALEAIPSFGPSIGSPAGAGDYNYLA